MTNGMVMVLQKMEMRQEAPIGASASGFFLGQLPTLLGHQMVPATDTGIN